MIVAVLDTNVLASGIAGFTKLTSTTGELLRRWRNEEFTLVVSEYILEELSRTFSNPYFTQRLSLSEIEDSFVRLRANAVVQPITVRVTGIASHPQDDAIIATALSARAGHLVTGDKKLLQRGAYRGTQLRSPREFLDLIAFQNPD